MTKALFFVDYPDRLRIAIRLWRAAEKNGHELVTFTNQLSLFTLGRLRGLPIQLVVRKNGDTSGYSERNHEVIAGHITTLDAQTLYASIVAAGSRLVVQHGITLILNWNGAHIHSLASRRLGEIHGLPVMFVELGNMNGRMLVSRFGSGSDLKLTPPKSSTEDVESVPKWVNEFRELRRRQAAVPQAATNLRVNYLGALDRIGWLISPRSNSLTAWSKFMNHVIRHHYAHRISEMITAAPATGFIFLLLQVSDDTNLTVRSAIDNFGAIQWAHDLASARNLDLVIKIHPAERSGRFLKMIWEFMLRQNNGRIIITNENAAGLIENCDEVVTINSTAGIEAILFDKPVTILSPTYYNGWSHGDIYWYANRYLTPFNPFGAPHADNEAWLDIVSRVDATAHGEGAR